MLKRLTGLFLILAMIMMQIPGTNAGTGAAEGAETAVFKNGEEETAASGEEETVGSGEEETAGSGEEEGTTIISYSDEQLVVGNPTPMEGNFFTDMWGTCTSDMDVRELLNAYNLVYWQQEEGVFAENPDVVSGIIVMDDEQGNKTYVLTLYRDLYFSDGTPITAKDYAFSILLQISPLITRLGGKPAREDYILGYHAYANGNVKELAGLRVIADDELMITISAEFSTFFFDLGLLNCYPFPIHIIAPGCEVKDEGNGAYIDGEFTVSLLEKTILDPETGYRSHPSVVSGPYMLTSYDGESAEFEINPYYKGDEGRDAPMIKKLKLVSVKNDEMIEKLTGGEVGLLNKVARADVITEGTSLIGSGEYIMTSYPRVGMSFTAFCCERPTVSSKTVRQAIAFCMDRDSLIADYTGSYGIRIDGYYGLGQWMYQMVSGTMGYPVQEPEDESAAAQKAYEEETAAWEALSMDVVSAYTLDVEKANELLDQDGWTLNEQGQPRSEGEIRCRETDGTLIPLKLKLAVAKDNTISESFAKHFVPYLAQAGIELEIINISMKDLLDQYYHRSERTVDMLYLGTSFDTMFDPEPYFRPVKENQTTWNYTEVNDEALHKATMDLRRTAPGNALEYCQKWLEFQKCFMDSVPMIPLYSNVYFDFSSGILHNYHPSENVGWSQAILSSFLSDRDDPEEEDTGEEEELGEDEMIFDE